MGLACLGSSGAAFAQAVLESVSNAQLTGSGPAINGPASGSQIVTLRRNTDNPAGTTFVASSSGLTVTYTLTNQQFSGFTSAELFTSGTGGNGVFFGGAATNYGQGGPAQAPVYGALSSLGQGASADFTSFFPSGGSQGIDAAVNAGVQLSLVANAIALRSPSTPTTARVHMADLVIDFSAAVDDPILHIAGMGGRTASNRNDATRTQLGISAEFDLLTPGLTFGRLSGNNPFVVSPTRIVNGNALIAQSCAAQTGACGSVMIQGNSIRTVTLRLYLRGDGALSSWATEPTSFNLDGLLVGMSVLEPGGPTVTVRKLTEGGVGTFSFTGTNGYAPTSVTTSAPNTVATGVRRTLAVANTPTTITEAATPGYRLSDISCTGLGVTGTATPSYVNNATVAGSVTLNAIATQPGWDVVCTFTNQRIPTLRLQKALPGGRAAEGNQFTLSMSGPNAPSAIITTGTGSTADGVLVHAAPSIGSSYTLSESAAGSPASVLANYATTYACTNALAGGQTPSGTGTSFTVTPAAGDDLTCTFSNALRTADVSVQKTASAPTVTSGQSVQFTLLVRNAGPAAADGAVIRDPASSGLNCVSVSCTAAGSATCPGSPTVGALQSPGLTIPALPSGGSVSLQLTCTVTASGF